MTVENTSTATEAGLLFSYYIVLSFWAAQGLGMSLLSRNVAGQTKKSVAVTMNFVAWAAGNAIGKFFLFFFLSSFFFFFLFLFFFLLPSFSFFFFYILLTTLLHTNKIYLHTKHPKRERKL